MAYACAVSYLVAITIVLWDIKYLNRPHKQEAGGEGHGNKAFVDGVRKTKKRRSQPSIFSYSMTLYDPYDPDIKRVCEPSLLNCSRHILPGLELGKLCIPK